MPRKVKTTTVLERLKTTLQRELRTTRSPVQRAKIRLAIAGIDAFIPAVPIFCHAEEYLPPPIYDLICGSGASRTPAARRRTGGRRTR